MPATGQPQLLFADSLSVLLEGISKGELPEFTGRPGVPSLVCSVQAADALASLTDCLAKHVPAVQLIEPSHGLDLELDSVEGVGMDRLFAARGALELAAGGAVVVQVGTALTVDAVAPGRIQGRFLGGAIAPGPELLARALHRGGAQLPLVRPVPEISALGRDTQGALRAGISVGLSGAVCALVEGVAAGADLSAAPIVLTGGAREFVRPALAALPQVLMEDEHLVARGMAAGYGDSLKA